MEGVGSQLLEVAVGNVVAAPVWNSVELDTVGELHLVLGLEPETFLGSFLSSAGFAVVFVFTSEDTTVVGELDVVGVSVGGQGSASVAGITRCDPSSLARACWAPRWDAAMVVCRASASHRGGIPGARQVANGGWEVKDSSGSEVKSISSDANRPGAGCQEQCGQADGIGASV